MFCIRVCFLIILVISSLGVAAAMTPDNTGFWSIGNGEILSKNIDLSRSPGSVPGDPTYVSMSGRVTTPEGRPIRGARIFLLDENNVVLPAYTSPLGYYRIEQIVAGRWYAMGVTHKRYIFAFPTTLIEIKEDFAMNFIGEINN